MLIRIVRLTLHPDKLPAFLALFDQAAPKVRRFPGCRHLELWQSKDNPGIVISYSHWDSASDLERYRQSDLFRDTWARAKPLFATPAEAFSAERVRTVAEN